jgi:hypothetical protein
LKLGVANAFVIIEGDRNETIKYQSVVMSSTTEPDSTSITGENIAPSQQIVRLQGGGLRFLDAHEIPQRDFNVVTRPLQNNNTQHWRLTNVGGNVHTIVQVSSGRFLDAHEIASLNFRVVRRPQQNSGTQRWRVPVKPDRRFPINQSVGDTGYG